MTSWDLIILIGTLMPLILSTNDGFRHGGLIGGAVGFAIGIPQGILSFVVIRRIADVCFKWYSDQAEKQPPASDRVGCVLVIAAGCWMCLANGLAFYLTLFVRSHMMTRH
jgi:ABC-type nickel/cobalt efflux system permease component RcnA